jgi:hypothetical protein
MSSAAFALLESRRHSKQVGAVGKDIPVTMSRRCGFRGPHASPTECIEALRNRIAALEFTKGKAAKGNAKRLLPERPVWLQRFRLSTHRKINKRRRCLTLAACP